MGSTFRLAPIPQIGLSGCHVEVLGLIVEHGLSGPFSPWAVLHSYVGSFCFRPDALVDQLSGELVDVLHSKHESVAWALVVV
jgi:hypothetical protein